MIYKVSHAMSKYVQAQKSPISDIRSRTFLLKFLYADWYIIHNLIMLRLISPKIWKVIL